MPWSKLKESKSNYFHQQQPWPGFSDVSDECF